MGILVAAIAGAIAGRLVRPALAAEGAPQGRLPVPEVLLAGLFALVAWRGDDWRVAPLLILAATLGVLALVDLADYRLPDAILFPGTAATVVLVAVGELVDGDADRIASAVVGAAVYTGILLVLHLVNPAGMGFGDVKLAVLLGFVVGWVAESRIDALRAVMLALLIGSALGVALGVLRIVAVRVGTRFLPDPEEGIAGTGWRNTTFPFGPPLMVGALAVVLFPGTLLG